MKNVKRILALAAAILLFAMYACTLIFALIGSPNALNLLWASIACTIILPVLLYGYMLVYRQVHDNQDQEDDDAK